MARASFLRSKRLNQAILTCGRIGSGKTTVSRHLSKTFNIPIVSFSSLIKDRALRAHIPSLRQNLQNLGYELFTTLGARLLTEEAIKHSGHTISETLIFDGVRHESVLSEIKNMIEEVHVIFLKADQNRRFSRYSTKDPSANLSLEDFRKTDDHPIESGIDRLEGEANIIIDASRPLDEVLSIAEKNIRNFLTLNR